MTTEVTIKNVSANKYPVVVNVWETQNPMDEGKNVERHDLKFGEEVTVRLWGWHRGVTILEASVP